MVMSRGQDGRSQMHAMSLLLDTCSGMTNRAFTDDGARCILQGDEQERENRTAGVKALHSMLAAFTSGRAKELVAQGLSERNGMIAFGRIRERFGKTAGVAKLSNVFQFQWTSPDSLENKWLRWQKLMRQANMTSLGDDAGETLTIAGLEKAQGTISGTALASACSTNLDSVVCKCGSVLANDGGLEQSAHANGNWCRDVNVCLLWQSWTRESEVSILCSAKCSNCGKTGHLTTMCRQREKSAGKSSPSSSSGKSCGKGGTSRGSADKCHCCGQVGRRRPDCPRRDENCSLCGKRGLLSHVGRSSRGHCQSATFLDSRGTLCLSATTPISRLTNLVTC